MLRKDFAPAPTPPDLGPEVHWMNLASNMLFAVAGFIALALAGLWLVRQPFFTLRSIRVEGDVTHNSVATIRANAAPALYGNFFTMNLRDSQQAFEAVPWVRHAVVQRVWPHHLKVRLEEHRAAAIWSPPEGVGGDAVDKLVNTFGEVFEANLGDIEDDHLVTLRGPEGSAQRMLEMLRQLNPVWDQWHTKIDELWLSGRGSWRVVLDSGAEVELGRGDTSEVRARCEQFVSTVGQLTARYQRPVEYADLRHRDGYALRLRGISTTLNAAERAAVNKKPKP